MFGERRAEARGTHLDVEKHLWVCGHASNLGEMPAEDAGVAGGREHRLLRMAEKEPSLDTVASGISEVAQVVESQIASADTSVREGIRSAEKSVEATIKSVEGSIEDVEKDVNRGQSLFNQGAMGKPARRGKVSLTVCCVTEVRRQVNWLRDEHPLKVIGGTLFGVCLPSYKRKPFTPPSASARLSDFALFSFRQSVSGRSFAIPRFQWVY